MTCLKCGRTVPEHTLLCQECLDSRNTPAPAAQEPLEEELEFQRIQKLQRRARRARKWLAVFIVLCILGAAVLAGAAYYIYRQYNRLSVQTSRINSLETAITETKEELERANARSETQRETIAEAQAIIEAFEARTGLTTDDVLAEPSPDANP